MNRSGCLLAKCVALALVAASISLSASAHHSGAQFDQKDQVEVAGVVTKVEWTNPHARLYVSARDERGADVAWEFELPSVNHLLREGWTTHALGVGDKVTVQGARARAFPPVALATRVTDAGGKKLFMSSPTSGQ